jgi:hypothetical protein
MSNSIFVQDRVTHKIPLEQRIDYIKNPLLAVEAIFGFELAYFQITCLNESWFKSSFMDCSGYGTGKTFRIALLMALRAILLPNRVQMIISHTYGGVKLVFDTYLEPWFHEIPGYRAHFADDIKSPVSKTSDLYSVKLANGNEIRGVPPAIMTGSTRLRSERCNDIYLDEFAHYHSQEEIDTVIKSRATRINPFHKIRAENKEDQLIKNALSNHKAFFSTPNYMFHESYKRAKYFITKTFREKSPNYGYESYSYEDLIKDGREDLTDLEAIEESKAMLPTELFERDYKGKWVAGSLGYYEYEMIKKIRTINIKPMLKGVDGDIYIKGCDVARSIKGKGDDFAISVIKFSPKAKFAHQFIYQVTKNNLDADQMACEIHEVEDKFPGPMIVVDPGGGGQFLTGPLSKNKIMLPGGVKNVIPIFDVDSIEAGGKNILYWFSRGTLAVKEIIGSMAGDDVLVNNAHNLLKNFIEKEKFIVPYSEEISVLFHRIMDKDMKSRNHLLSKLTEEEIAYYNLELTMMQLQGIKQKVDKQTGKPSITSRGQFTFLSTRKKDSAYSLLYAIFGTYLYEEMTKAEGLERDEPIISIGSQAIDMSNQPKFITGKKLEREKFAKESKFCVSTL